MIDSTKKNNNTLFYLGVHKGDGLDKLIPNYSICYGFEADPQLASFLQNKYRSSQNVKIIHGAATTFNGKVKFNISSNNGESSSIGNFDKDWDHFKNGEIKMSESVEVPAIDIYEFLKNEGIEYLDSYVSDIQGMDLEVLESLRPYIEQRKIGKITCEVTKDEYGNIYYDLPDNSKSGFQKLLGDNYFLCASGGGLLQEGNYEEVPDDWWEMDCMWCLK